MHTHTHTIGMKIRKSLDNPGMEMLLPRPKSTSIAFSFMLTQIIAMENNSVRAKGTYRVIESKDYELIQQWNAIIAKENAKDESIE